LPKNTGKYQPLVENSYTGGRWYQKKERGWVQISRKTRDYAEKTRGWGYVLM
jgi:hypothetical protein